MDIFSEDFIRLRSKVLNINEEQYKEKMYVKNYLNKNTYSELNMWFGKDTFCQMNLLALLKYLEQIDYHGKIILNYIDDETFKTVESNINVTLGIYSNIYKKVLILKQMPNETGVLDENAIKLYFDYHSENGKLAKIVKLNPDKSKFDLICFLLAESKDYGLSDLQAERLIELNRK